MNEELRNKIIDLLKKRGYDKIFANDRVQGFLNGIYGLLHKPYPDSWATAAQKIRETELDDATILELKGMV